MILRIESDSLETTLRLGEGLGRNLRGGEVIEIRGDVGSGKTTFVKGIAKGAGSSDFVASPSFTLSRIYKGRGEHEVHHYDFYRLNDPGVLKDELVESIADRYVTTVIEWARVISDVLPKTRVVVELQAEGRDRRRMKIAVPDSFNYLIEGVR